MISVLVQGLGATAEEKLKVIAPLVEYFDTEIGVGEGRLMLATNFLRDAREMQPDLNLEAKTALAQAEALVVSNMTRFLNTVQEHQSQGESCACGEGVQAQAQSWLEKAKNRS